MTDHDHPVDPALDRLAADARCGCEESRLLLSRRAMLGVTVGLFTSALLPREGFAAAGTDPRVLIIILRGGMDGMDAFVPYGDPNYAWRRKHLVLDKSQLIDIGDPDFAFHPNLPKIAGLYKAGQAAVVPATCIPLRTRSHFDCQDNLENGMPAPGNKPVISSSGWLNRVLQALPTTSPIRVGGGISINEAPLILRGTAPTLGWSLNWLPPPDPATVESLRQVYAKTDKTMAGMLDRGLYAHALATKSSGNVTDANDQSMDSLTKSFRGAARLLADPGGPRLAVITVDDFDTHASQDEFLVGRFGYLDNGIGDMPGLMGDAWNETIVIAISEFGRNATVNGSSGTDHGVGTAAILAGGALAGGKHYGGWPGLAQANLWENADLYPIVDTRAIFKAILEQHLGFAPAILNNTIFPGSADVQWTHGQIVKSPAAKWASATAEAPVQFASRADSAIARYRAEYGLSLA